MAGAWRHTVRVLRRLRFTLALVSVVLIAGILTGTVLRGSFPELMRRFGWDLDTLLRGQVYKPWPALFFSSQPGPRVTMLIILALGVSALELRRGPLVAAVAFFGLGPPVDMLSMLFLWPAEAAGVSWLHPFLHTPDMGSSGSALVCWGMAVSDIGGRWAVFLAVGTYLPLLGLLVFYPQQYALEHLIAFTVGLLAGTWLFKTKPAPRPASGEARL